MATANQVTASAARPAKATPLMRLVRAKPLKWVIVTVMMPVLDILLAPVVLALRTPAEYAEQFKEENPERLSA
jgi:hypothetical protein